MSVIPCAKTEQAAQVANTWVHDVAAAFGTEGQQFAYRVVRAAPTAG